MITILSGRPVQPIAAVLCTVLANSFLELIVKQFEMDAEENGDEIGTLKVTPILLMIGYQSMPKNQSGFAFHASIGGGYASSDFDKGDDIKDLERANGVKIDIDNDDAFMFEMGARVDYFHKKHSTDVGRSAFVAGDIDSKWDLRDGNSESVRFQRTGHFEGLVRLGSGFNDKTMT